MKIARILSGPWEDCGPLSPELQAHKDFEEHGYNPPANITMDGEIHRFSTKDGHDKNGWYCFFSDNVPAGSYGDWSTGQTVLWKADIGRTLSPQEISQSQMRIAQSKTKRDEETKKRHELASDAVATIWASCGPASVDHPYIKRKGIKPYCLRITGDGRLVAPLYNIDGELTSLQYIGHDGTKQYHSGGSVKGSFYWIPGEKGTIYIAEGFATGATVAQATNKSVVVAYSAGNIVAVVEALRSKHPQEQITIVADNDASGTGQSYANQAAAKYGATVIMPPNVGEDANDYAQHGGDLLALLEQSTEKSWLVGADELSRDMAPLKWLVKKYLQQGSFAMVHGPSGSGKSFLVLDWSMRIASDIELWCDKKISHGTVVYLAGEGHYGIRARIAAWKQYHDIASLDMFVSSCGVDLDQPQGLQKTLSSIRSIGRKPVLIVVDTLHRFLSGDENSAQDAKLMLDACAILQSEFDCTVLLVHHTGVSEEAQHRPRGSSSWKGALDNELSVRQKKGELVITPRKMKDSDEAQEITMKMVNVPIEGWLDEDGDQVCSLVLEQSDSPQAEEPKKKNSDIVLLRDMWLFADKKTVDGVPLIPQADAKKFLIKMRGKSESAATQYLKPSNSKGFAGRLLFLGVLAEFEEGFLVVDQEASSFILLSAGK
jgi:putative DNA primase/helicase